MRLLSRLTDDLFPVLLMAILLIFPFFGYVTRSYLDIKPTFILGGICMSFMFALLVERFSSNTSIKIPRYLIILGVFILYTTICGLVVSDKIAEMGIVKYIFKDPFIRCFVIFLLIENLSFSPRLIKICIQALFVLLLIAAAVSIIQISKPFFFLDKSMLLESNMGSSERFLHYYSNNPSETTGEIRRLLGGYRFSIFSYVAKISVGVDGMAIFSLLFGLKMLSGKKRTLSWGAAALVSFLSSSRWIMLNFIVISFQRALTGKQVIFRALKYLVLIVLMLALTVYGATMLGIDLEQFIQKRLMASSFTSRFYAVEVFSRLFPLQPIWGTGGADTAEMIRLTSARGTSTIHVGYLLLFFYYGLVGGITYLLFLGSLLQELRLRAIRSAYWGAFFAFIGFAVANLTLPAIDPSFFGLFLALIFSKSINNQSSETAPKKVPRRKHRKVAV